MLHHYLRRRYPWTEEKLLAAPPRDVSALQPKPPRPLVVTYPFSTDEHLREHVGGSTGRVKISRVKSAGSDCPSCGWLGWLGSLPSAAPPLCDSMAGPLCWQ